MDPFTMVYSALWDCLLAQKDFARLVPVGNRIRFDNDSAADPIKLQIAVADTPEIMLISQNIEANLYDTSSSSKITRQYSWQISTGDFRASMLLYPVEWTIFVGMLAWKDKLAALKYCGKSFCKNANIVTGVNGYSDPNANRGIVGWSALWTCQVDLYFDTDDLRALLRGI